MTSDFTGIFNLSQATSEQERDFAIILYAPTEVSVALDSLRSRYDPAVKLNIPPHITIKRPTRLEKGVAIDQVQQALDEVSRNLPPFIVKLDSYGIFRKAGSNVVFLKPSDETPLCQLHNLILDSLNHLFPGGLADSLENHNYHPHLTIGNKLSDLELSVMELELNSGKYRLDFEFKAEEFGLLTQPNGLDVNHSCWETVAHFRFRA